MEHCWGWGLGSSKRGALFDRLGRVLILPRLGQLLRVLLSSPQREARLGRQFRRLKPTVECADNVGRRVDLAQKRLHLVMGSRDGVTCWGHVLGSCDGVMRWGHVLGSCDGVM